MLLTIMPRASWMFVAATMGTVALYSLKKFEDNSSGLMFVTTNRWGKAENYKLRTSDL